MNTKKQKVSDKMGHSAYKSMWLAKENKNKTVKNGDLKRWIDEKWINLTASLYDNKPYACGKKHLQQVIDKKPSVCRPSVKINKDTPKLASEFTKKQIQKAITIKQKGGRIEWAKL